MLATRTSEIARKKSETLIIPLTTTLNDASHVWGRPQRGTLGELAVMLKRAPIFCKSDVAVSHPPPPLPTPFGLRPATPRRRKTAFRHPVWWSTITPGRPDNSRMPHPHPVTPCHPALTPHRLLLAPRRLCQRQSQPRCFLHRSFWYGI